MLGVECDGATYHSAKSVRDRDLLRQKILEKKGWQIYRIWSTDWFKNRESAVEKLLTTLQELIGTSRAKISEIASTEKVPEEANGEEIYDAEEYASVEATTIITKNGGIDFEATVREALLEFRRKRIEPSIENLDNSILSDALLEEFINRLPTSKDDFFQFPLTLREKITRGQAPEFLEEILEIIEEYNDNYN